MPLFTDTAPRLASPVISLPAGQVWAPPAGWYYMNTYRTIDFQRYDAVSQIWRYAGDESIPTDVVYFDGLTTRLANTTGCVVAAIVTSGGSGYTTAPTVTPSAGAAVMTAILGGAISTVATITNAGSNYQYPPLLWFPDPPAPGVRAAGTITITSGTISAVTITEQGAGYTLPPNPVVINDYRDTVGANGAVSVAITGAGTVTAVLVNNHGNPITSGTVPTLSFSSGAAAATAVMDWCVTSASITTAGSGYTNAAGSIMVTGAGGAATATPALTGTDVNVNFSRWRPANIQVTTTGAGALSAIAQIVDPGRYQAVPTPAVDAAQNSPSAAGVFTLTMGGVSGTAFLTPAQPL